MARARCVSYLGLRPTAVRNSCWVDGPQRWKDGVDGLRVHGLVPSTDKRKALGLLLDMRGKAVRDDFELKDLPFVVK